MFPPYIFVSAFLLQLYFFWWPLFWTSNLFGDYANRVADKILKQRGYLFTTFIFYLFPQ